MATKRKYVFKIRRFNPEDGSRPSWDRFELQMEPSERILDGLIRIKDTIDGTLTFRRSCAHGICGSCAVNVNGKNALACQTLLKDMPQTILLRPLPALTVIKDLVVDIERFFRMNNKVLPYPINDETPPERERRQSPQEQARILQSITCIMCASCSTSCPTFWSDEQYLGPSAMLKAYRFIFDSRDRAYEVRLGSVADHHGLWRCHSIFNCVEVCPKDIDITDHIATLKRHAAKRKFSKKSGNGHNK